MITWDYEEIDVMYFPSQKNRKYHVDIIRLPRVCKRKFHWPYMSTMNKCLCLGITRIWMSNIFCVYLKAYMLWMSSIC